MSIRTKHLTVVELEPGKFAVVSSDLAVKVGPNPLRSKRIGEYVLAVIKRLDVDCRFPQPPSAGLHNERAVGGDDRLKLWLANQRRDSINIHKRETGNGEA